LSVVVAPDASYFETVRSEHGFSETSWTKNCRESLNASRVYGRAQESAKAFHGKSSVKAQSKR
jgi:hypothetical protein